ncbi:VPLPA-CTERM sorting domain-containing protein [Maridesulfovibrio sp.]|uniref:VPLPA-CTERM sorting domain-containing protein n=1 Tax=unclassified Maridesulfovibrio TaxID=2794999 RepID=UPI003B00A6B8
MRKYVILMACLSMLLFGISAQAATFANSVDYFMGSGLSATSVRANPLNSLGSYDAPAVDSQNVAVGGDYNFLSLGMGGSAVFSFGRSFTGPVTIYETTWNRPNNYNEYAQVWAATDDVLTSSGVNLGSDAWVLLSPSIYNQDGDSFGGQTVFANGIYSYLKVTDTTGSVAGGSSGDGFDINAVSVSPTPIPGAIWILGAGLAGLIGVRRRIGS